METLVKTPTTTKKNGTIIPGGIWEACEIGFQLLETDHPFLQRMINAGIRIFFSDIDQEITLSTSNTLLLIRIYKTHVQLECIATREAYRRCGSGTSTMKLLARCADDTGTLLKLVTAKISGFRMQSINRVVAAAAAPNNRQSFSKLAPWFERFGFVAGGHIKNDYKKEIGIQSNGITMERQPARK